MIRAMKTKMGIHVKLEHILLNPRDCMLTAGLTPPLTALSTNAFTALELSLTLGRVWFPLIDLPHFLRTQD